MAPEHPSPSDALAQAAFALLWGVVGVAGCVAVMNLEPNMVEEGLVVHVAQRLAAGEHLYRDIVFFTGPVPFELLGLLFRLFGEEIAVGRAFAAGVSGVNAAAAFALVWSAGGRSLSHAAGAVVASLPLLLFPLFSMFYYTPLAFSFGLWATFCAFRGVESSRWAAAAGVLVAAVALCKQTLGVALAASLFAALLAASPAGLRVARARAMVGGASALALLTLVFYGVRGDLPDLWRCLVTVPLTLGESFSSRYLNLWPPGVLDADLYAHKVIYFPNLYFLKYGIFAPLPPRLILGVQVLYALPLLALAATPLARLAGPLPKVAWLNGAFLLAMTANLFPRSDWGHLVYALPPAALQLMILLGRPAGRLPVLRPLLSLAVVATVAGYALVAGRFVHGEAGPPYLWGERVPQRPVSAIYRTYTIPRLIRYLRARTEPGDPIFVARSEPLLYFATETVNPTPYEGVLTGIYEEQQENILAALPDVKFVVISDLDQPMWTYYHEELPRVQQYLERHFRIADGYPLDDGSWIVVLEHGEDRGETWLDLFRELPNARRWILDEQRRERPDERPITRLVARHNRRSMPMRLGHWGGGIDYTFVVPENARFEAGVGYRGMVSLEDLHVHPRRSHMVVEVGRDGVFEEVLRHKVADVQGGGRRWTPVEADLSRFAGQEITLRLTIDAAVPIAERDMSWWGSPRIVVADAPAQATSVAPEELDQ
ncbi:MAG: hypothetical protein ACQGVC_12645 [Myxococcota bacterium]